MDIQTQKGENLGKSADNFRFFTLQRKVLDRSNISFIFVNKQKLNTPESTSSDPTFNRNLGMEYNYFSKDNLWDGKLLFIQSFSPLEGNQASVFASHIGHQRTRWNWRIQQEYVSENYSAEVGFVPRNNYVELETKGGHLIYTKSETSLLSYGPSVALTYYFDTSFDKKDESTVFKYNFNFKNRSRLSIGLQNQFIQLLSNFDPVRTGIAELQAGTEHRWNSYTILIMPTPKSIHLFLRSPEKWILQSRESHSFPWRVWLSVSTFFRTQFCYQL